jgi:Kae1-associated kinase Bud32
MSEILSQGAEAIITQQGEEVTKKRIEKAYRLKELDEKIRKLRTRNEAKLLERASKIIPVPKILKVDENKKEIIMQAIEGKRLSGNLDKFSMTKQKEICEKIGENIAKLHEANIIHGDLTTSNMILVENQNGKKGNSLEIYFIDFGLGFISPKAEDKAVDLHLLREAFEAGFANEGETMFNWVKDSYSRTYKDAHSVLERFKIVEKRGRYKQGS